MRSGRSIRRCSAEQIDAQPGLCESRTDWAAADAIPQAEVERAADDAEGPLPDGWAETVIIGLPPGKQAVRLRVDSDVLDWFRASGKGDQTRMNTVLRAFVRARAAR